jgi:hypothetical protein
MILPVEIAVEGLTDEVVMKRLLDQVGLPYGHTYGKRGKDHILKALNNYNQAARHSPWVVLVDLDDEPECAPLLVRQHLPRPNTGMKFRVAVRAIEAWLLADRDTLAEFLAVSRNRLPSQPETEPDPKATLISLARQSRRRDVRDGMVPRPGSGAKVGPDYIAYLTQYVTHLWRPDVAAQHSDSLRRCIEALQTLKNWTPAP